MQALEREVATFASSQKSRIKAAQDKLKAAKVRTHRRNGHAHISQHILCHVSLAKVG